MFEANGIYLKPSSPAKDQEVEIFYKGLLVNSGADGVYLHYGHDGWQSVKTVPMHRQEGNVFHAQLKAEGEHELDFCFKDSADNWDNNNGWNWGVRF
ncbi:MAG: carbohydrate-binding protein [Firmicutes bacterium]|nr:carbohydrate-binding protein [Bacillota bacterium]